MLCSLFLVFCVVWPGAYAVEVPDLDDLDIDPWGDLGLIQETPEPASTAPIGEPVQMDPVELEPAGEGGISFSARAANSADTLSLTYSYQSSVTKSASGWSVLYGYTGNNMANYTVSYQYPGNTYSYSKSYSYTASVSSMKAFTAVNYSADNFSKINVTINTFCPRVCWANGAHTTKNDSTYYGENYSLFAYVQLLVNGEPYGQKYALSSYAYGNAITLNEEIELGKGLSTVTSLGLLWTFASSSININGSGTITYSRTDNREWVKPRFDLYLVTIQSGGTSNLVVSTVSPGPGMDEETKGLLGTIIAWLTSIRDTIGSVFTAIIELPGRIATVLIEGIKSLFIPDEEDLTGLKDQYAQLLEERLGFVWQAGEMVISFGQSVLSAFETATDFQFEFPGVSFELPELGQVTLIEPQVVSVDNAFMDVMQPVLGTIVSFICVLAFINTAERMVVAVVSGVSYFHFLKGD